MKAEKAGILKAVENGWAIEDSLDKLEELRRRSYTAEQITKFFSANFLRVFREHDR